MEVNAQDLGARSEGYSGADISAVCHQAALRAIRRAVHAGEEPAGSGTKISNTKVSHNELTNTKISHTKISHVKVSIEATDLEAALQSIHR